MTETKVLLPQIRQLSAGWTISHPVTVSRSEQVKTVVKQQGISVAEAEVWLDLQETQTHSDLLEEHYAAILSKYIADEIDREIIDSIKVKWKTATTLFQQKTKFGI